MRLIAFASLLPIAISAQSQVAPGDLCSIEGRVVNALTGEPLKKASLVLRHSDPGPLGSLRPAYSTVSFADGQFAMKDLEPGSYWLLINRSGFLATEYGARRPGQRGTVLVLGKGQALKDVNFRLTPHGVVSGRVVDEDGDPVINAQVQLLRLRYSRGRKQLESVGRRWPGYTTDDLGEYRIFGLMPGKYSLAVSYQTTEPQSLDRTAIRRVDENYVTSYYPGTADAAAAIMFEVTAGVEVHGIDVKLSKAHAVTVRGHVTNAAMPGHPYMQVSLVPRSSKGGFNPSSQPDASGRFEIRHVVSGSYFLSASVSENDKFYTTRQPVDVRDEDVDNLNLTISPGVALPGRVRVEGDGIVELERISFNLIPAEISGSNYASLKDDDPTFRFDGLNADHYHLRTNGLPEGYYVKSARSGEVDVLASGLEVGTDPLAPLEVVFSPRAGRISGSAQSPVNRHAASFSVVTLVPQEKERRDQEWYYQTITTDQSGIFELKSVAPGEYELFAWDEIEEGAYMDPDFLKPFESKGISVSVKEGSQLSEQLTLISAAPAAVESIRAQ